MSGNNGTTQGAGDPDVKIAGLALAPLKADMSYAETVMKSIAEQERLI